MAQTKRRLMIFVVLALLAIFAACKGESPTAPPVTTPNTPSGGGTGASGTTLSLAVSNASPLINSTSVVTATVTVNGAPAPNGTAVEFISDLGTFTEVSDVKVVRTTTSGAATATLTSPGAGKATVTATVNNVSKSIVVTFGTTPSGPPPPASTTPTITAVTPNFGLPTGGETITVTGTNFIAPVRVIFDFGAGIPTKDGLVVSVTPTQIVVVTPPIDLSSGQTQVAAITVITQAGSSSEQRVSRAAAFTYQLAVLTPVIRAVSPTAGPIEGGTRVTIIGDAFQAPVQVFFGAAQAQVINVAFNQIIAISPTARDTAANGSGPVTGPVDIRVVNVGAGKSVTLTAGFRYTPKMQITAVTPNQGPFTGGTRVLIDGTGFDDPVTVTLNGIAAQVIKVTGTEIIAISSAIALQSCADATGPIVVTNVNNGDSAPGPSFIYKVSKPAILSVTAVSSLGGAATITVLNGIGIARITIGGISAPITGQTTDPITGITTFTIIVPTTLKLDTLGCTGVPGALAAQPTPFDVTYLSLTTSCTDTAPKALTINPANAPLLFVSPSAFAPFSAKITPATPGSAGPPIVPPTPASVTGTSQPPITIANTGSAPLNITSATKVGTGGAGCANFTITLPPAPSTLNQCESVLLSATYNGQTTPTTDQCQVQIVTNAGTKTFNLTGTSQ